MDSIMTAGTRGLTPSGSFGVRAGAAAPQQLHVRHGKPTALAARVRTDNSIGTAVPFIDRMRTSAPEP